MLNEVKGSVFAEFPELEPPEFELDIQLELVGHLRHIVAPVTTNSTSYSCWNLERYSTTCTVRASAATPLVQLLVNTASALEDQTKSSSLRTLMAPSLPGKWAPDAWWLANAKIVSLQVITAVTPGAKLRVIKTKGSDITERCIAHTPVPRNERGIALTTGDKWEVVEEQVTPAPALDSVDAPVEAAASAEEDAQGEPPLYEFEVTEHVKVGDHLNLQLSSSEVVEAVHVARYTTGDLSMLPRIFVQQKGGLPAQEILSSDELTAFIGDLGIGEGQRLRIQVRDSAKLH